MLGVRVGTSDVRFCFYPFCASSLLTLRSRHQYPNDMYATWDSPTPLSGLLPRPPTKQTTGITSTSAAAGDNRTALPEVREIEYYLRSVLPEVSSYD